MEKTIVLIVTIRVKCGVKLCMAPKNTSQIYSDNGGFNHEIDYQLDNRLPENVEIHNRL